MSPIERVSPVLLSLTPYQGGYCQVSSDLIGQPTSPCMHGAVQVGREEEQAAVTTGQTNRQTNKQEATASGSGSGSGNHQVRRNNPHPKPKQNTPPTRADWRIFHVLPAAAPPPCKGGSKEDPNMPTATSLQPSHDLLLSSTLFSKTKGGKDFIRYKHGTEIGWNIPQLKFCRGSLTLHYHGVPMHDSQE